MGNNQIKKNKNGHLPVINSLRGIAAIMIMIHHITVYLLPQISVYTQETTPFFRKNYLWVDFFFILSGFIACHAYKAMFKEKVSGKNFKHFIISRFSRLYPLHFIVLCLFVIVELIYLYFYHVEGLAIKHHHIPFPFEGVYSLKQLLLGMTMLNALPSWGSWNGPSWAMSAIWITAFVLPFIINMSFKIKMIGHLLIVMACYVILWVLLEKSKTLDIMAAGGMIRCLSETVIGIGCYNIYSTIPPNRLLTSNYLLGFCLILVFISMLLHINHIATVFMFFALILIAAYHGKNSLFSNSCLILLGDLSFSIYIIHWLPCNILDKISLIAIGSKFNSTNSQDMIAMTVLFVVILIIYLSYWAHYNIEKPSRKYMIKQFMNIVC